MNKNSQLASLCLIIVAVLFGGYAVRHKAPLLAFIAGAASVLTYFVVLFLTGELKAKGDIDND